ncbi:MAG: O-antigen ligase family protein [Burkholderiaceae bacterium]
MTTRTSSPLGKALFAGWWAMVAILPIGHLTGLRNAWTVVIVVATLAWVRRDAWQDLPARTTLLVLLAWCAASIGWSTSPEVSFGKFRSDLLIPLLSYAAAYGYARHTGSIRPIVGGLVTGLALLAVGSLYAFVPPPEALGLHEWIRTETFANIVTPMPIWYPGVGDASMAASLAAGLFLFARRIGDAIGRTALGIGWLALLVIVWIANNRNAEIGIAVVAIVCLWMSRRRRNPAASSRRTTVLAVGVAVVAIVLVGVQLESGARARLEALKIPIAPGQSAFVELTSRDTRPMIWSYYTRLALKSPWIGVGFGRTVPGIHYGTEKDVALARIEVNAYTHAHNLFLNWWLQTGAIGVALLTIALAQLVAAALRRPGYARPAGFAMLAILALMLIRDATDDFLIYGMATLFWTLLGGLAGLRSPTVAARAVAGDARASRG